MRWDGLFADLEAQAHALAEASRSAEVEERTRAEVGRLTLQDRLRPAVGTELTFGCRGGVRVTGTLLRTHVEWLLLDDATGRETLLTGAGVLTVAGLGRPAAVPDSGSVVESRLGLRHALRGIARDRSAVRLALADGSGLDGTLDRVGADFVELAVHPAGESRRRSAVREVLVVPFGSVVALTRQG